MAVTALSVSQRHANDDGSGIVVIEVSTEHGDGVITINIDPDNGVTGEATGEARLIPLGLWDAQ